MVIRLVRRKVLADTGVDMADQKKEDPRKVSDDCIDTIDALLFALGGSRESGHPSA